MEKYYISVDGGGSKTAFCALTIQSGAIHTSYAGKSNYKIAEADMERTNILEGFRALFADCGFDAECVQGLVMGMSGCDTPEDFAHYWDIALQTGIDRNRIYLCNDSELAFYAGGTPPGLCMIAGTGSVSTGITKDGRKARAGGWGFPISDEGSGAWIGAKALRATLRHADGYAPFHPLFDEIRKSFGAKSFAELPFLLAQVNVTEIAGKAKLVMDLADGDKNDLACALVEKAAHLAARIAMSVYNKLDFAYESHVDVVMAGSLFKSISYRQAFQTDFAALLPASNVSFLMEVKSPVLGGITLAKQMFPLGK